MSECPVCHAGTDAGARYCGGCGAAIVATKSSQHRAQKGPDPLGQEVAGRYRIIAKLGEGGMGAVYRAEQISLKRRVALKVLKPELSAEPGLVRRFNAEAELAAKLNHPNTVTLYDFGQDEAGALFIAMEFIEGRSLRQELVRSGPLPLDRIVDITSQICASLADAHATGIVHRDLKPDNVMLSERGRKSSFVTVLDFGIAKLRDDKGDITQQAMTRAGDILGTPQYMAPEQIRGERVDARTDVYALGVMLYEMVTARLPFEGNTIMALLSKHLTEEPVAPAAKRPDLEISPALSTLVMHCLAKNPAQRPATMDQVEQALCAALEASPDPSEYVTAAQHRPQMPPQPGMHASLASLPQDSRGAMPPAPMQHSPLQPMQPAPMQPAPMQPAPMQPVPMQPMQPAPMPYHQDTLRTRPEPRSKALLWSMLALLLLGAGGTGAYFALAGSDEEDSSQDDDFDMGTWQGDQADQSNDEPDNEDGPQDIESAQERLQAQIERLEGGSEELDAVLGALENNGPGQSGQDQVYEDSAFSYRMTMPAGFIGGGDGVGNATFTGLIKEHQVIILTSAWAEPGQFAEDNIEAALQLRLASLDLETTRIEWIGRGEDRRLRGSLRALVDQQQGDFVLKRRGSVFFFVAVGGRPTAYRNTAAFRQGFLNSGYRAP